MNAVVISVVIPTFNRPVLLIKCLDALAAQTLSKDRYEVIVVSDGPDMATNDLMTDWIRKEYLVNTRFLMLDHHKGPAAARNLGWKHATGEMIAFTDDDCLPDKNWLAEFLNHYTPGCKVAYSGQTVVPLIGKPTDHERNTRGLQFADFITANCCCPKLLLQWVGGFDERFTMAWREDSDLQFKLIGEGVTILKAEQAVIIHPVRSARWGVSIREQKKTMFNALLYKNYPSLYRQKIQPRPPFNYYIIITGFMLLICGVMIRSSFIGLIGFAAWCVFTAQFIYKRLSSTRLTLKHISEMVVTSLLIPFLSIYWQMYGAIKYRVLFF